MPERDIGYLGRTFLLRSKRGSTLTELVIVMAVVEIMSIMVVSFTLICNSWVTIGAKRYQTVQDSEMLSRVFRDFVAANDSSDTVFYVDPANPNELLVKKNSETVNRMVFSIETKELTFSVDGELVTYVIDAIDSVRFGNPTFNMVCATVDYTYATPGKKVQEQHKSYNMVASLRSSDAHAEAPEQGGDLLSGD